MFTLLDLFTVFQWYISLYIFLFISPSQPTFRYHLKEYIQSFRYQLQSYLSYSAEVRAFSCLLIDFLLYMYRHPPPTIYNLSAFILPAHSNLFNQFLPFNYFQFHFHFNFHFHFHF